MSHLTADVSTATTKRETDCTALKMGLFLMNAVVGPVSSETVITEVQQLATPPPLYTVLFLFNFIQHHRRVEYTL